MASVKRNDNKNGAKGVEDRVKFESETQQYAASHNSTGTAVASLRTSDNADTVKAAATTSRKTHSTNHHKTKESSSSVQQQQQPLLFPVGVAGKRELRNVLKSTTNPAKTIHEFQQSHSLHTMISKACNTIPISKYKVSTRSRSLNNSSISTGGSNSGGDDVAKNVESLDTDSVMAFLSHLGISQYHVHKRITDAILNELCDTIRQTSATTSTNSSSHNSLPVSSSSDNTTTAMIDGSSPEGDNTNPALYDVLKSSWVYATTIPELRPVVWSIFKQLGNQTPIPALLALTERADSTHTAAAASTNNAVTVTAGSTTGSTLETIPPSRRIKLKHAEIYKPLALSLKQLCWEVDWEQYIPFDYSNIPDPHEFLTIAQSTLLYDTIQNDIDAYTQNTVLCDMANHPFVTSTSERRIITTQRRALTTTGTAPGNSNTNTSTPVVVTASSSKALTTGKAVSHLRHLLCSAGGSHSNKKLGTTAMTTTTNIGNNNTATMTYRPKLLYAVLSILMAKYCNAGSGKVSVSSASSRSSSSSSDMVVIGGAQHLNCTLVADILLLSAGGPLPKPYNDVLSLARTLDDIVQEANLSDSGLLKVQSLLKLIFQPDQVNDVSTGTGNTSVGIGNPIAKLDESAVATAGADAPTPTVQRQLNRFVMAGLISMKECDPQQLFLNPVTDQIAPGYSAIIKQPMSIITMEHKLKQNQYHSVSDWENDVTLMYKNCINYNRGTAGQWFRNEANRQAKIFREEIFPKAKRLYQNEIAKRNFMLSSNATTSSSVDGSHSRFDDHGSNSSSVGLKRPANVLGIEIVPLMPSMKKRKKEREEFIPSMPALASMLLADPFVVRIIIARLMTEFRLRIIPGQIIPCFNMVVPSLLQLLHIVRYSKDICAMRGKKFFIPPAGFDKVENDDDNNDPTAVVSYTCLRQYTPLLVRLLLESEFDRRITMGGDLHQVSQSTLSVPIPLPSIHSWMDNTEQKAHVATALLQASIIHLCLPGHHTETSLSVTFPKFASALQGIAADSSSLLQERIFFNSLQETILRNKTKLPRSARDSIVTAWMGWLKEGGTSSIATPAHEYLIKLINDWYNLGNVLLPRDVMIRFCTNIVETVNTSTNKFAFLWQESTSISNIAAEFIPIRKHYENMLKQLPEASATQWMERHGITLSNEPVLEETAG